MRAMPKKALFLLFLLTTVVVIPTAASAAHCKHGEIWRVHANICVAKSRAHFHRVTRPKDPPIRTQLQPAPKREASATPRTPTAVNVTPRTPTEINLPFTIEGSSLNRVMIAPAWILK
jgi:hypothetical protein